MSDTCPICGLERQMLARHWNSNKCTFPEFTSRQKNVLTGLVMGDAYVNRRKGRLPRLRMETTNPEYLTYLDDLFGPLSTGEPSLRRTSEELSKRDTIPRFDNSEYKDQYDWGTRSHPELSSWAEWYKNGKKTWPENISLTPTTLKHWYCGDGSFHKDHYTITIYLSNEADSKQKVDRYFTRVGLPSPRWYKRERRDGSIAAEIGFNKDESAELIEYMGESIPGFDYKWP